MDWATLTHPDDLSADVSNFEQLLSGAIEGYSLDKRFLHKDGATVYCTLSVSCVRSADLCVDYMVALIQDITAAVVKNFGVTADAVLVEIIESSRDNKAKGGVLFSER